MSQFDPGLCAMERPKNMSTVGSCNVGETIGIIGAVCRITHLALKKQCTIGVESLLSHDVMDPLLRLSFR